MPDIWSVKKINPNNMVYLTEKPVEAASRAIQYSLGSGESVLDLFGGSAATLIGCEQIGRRAFLMELDPLYCDVLVERWQQFTGRKASRGPQMTPPGRAIENSDKTTVLGWVNDVLRILLAGGEIEDIRQYASAHGWQVSNRQFRRYQERTYSRLAKYAGRNQVQLLGRHLMQRRVLFAQVLKEGDTPAAPAILRDEAALEGLGRGLKRTRNSRSWRACCWELSGTAILAISTCPSDPTPLTSYEREPSCSYDL